MEGMDALREAVELALTNYRRGVIAIIIKTLTELAAEDPKAEYSFTSGMGVWHFTRKGLVTEDGETGIQEDDDYSPEPAVSAIDTAYDNYNYQGVPTGDFKVKGKKILVSTLE